MRRTFLLLSIFSFMACADYQNTRTEESQGASPLQENIEETFNIIDGWQVSEDSFVAQRTVAILTETSGGTSLCTGAILSSIHIVTAAHCLYGANGPNKVSIVTDTNIYTAADSLSVASFTIHPDYGPMLARNDIALVTLAASIPSNFDATLSVSADQTKSIIDDRPRVLIAGYGLDQNQSVATASSGILNAVTVVVDEIISDNIYEHISFSAENGKGSCSGDSGGPMFAFEEGVGPKLIGVTSLGYDYDGRTNGDQHDCVGSMTETRYTHVGPYLDWLESTAKRSFR